MRRKAGSPNVVTLAEARIRRALAGLGTFPGSEADAVALSENLARRLAELPPDQRRLLRRDLSISTNDLEELVKALEAELGMLAEDLRAMNLRTNAAQAYRRAATIAPRFRS